MRMVTCHVVALPEVGDDLRICYTDSQRGGRSEAAFIVRRDMFWRDVAEGEETNGREINQYRPTAESEMITEVKYTEAESKELFAKRLVEQMRASWGDTDLFAVDCKGTMVVITCANNFITYYPMCNGTELAGRKVISFE